MKNDHYVIIGNGVAANRAADVLRQGDSDGRITLISQEFFPFYYRYRLREYIAGTLNEADLIVRPVSYYKDQRIRLRLGQKVTRVDLEQQVIYLKHMEKVHYTHLLLCSGGKPRIPEIFLDFREYFTVMKTLADARNLKARLPGIQKLVIIGGDLVSVRMASAFTHMSIDVFFILHDDAFWPLELTRERRDSFVQMLRKKGVHVVDDQMLQRVEKNDAKGLTVVTDHGEKIQCDLIGAFFGLTPDVDFLVGSGLDIDRGILVDEYLRSPIENVFAAGDCAQVYNPSIRNYWVSIGWKNARTLGEMAAHNVLGSKDLADAPPHTILNWDGIQVDTPWWQDLSGQRSDQ